MQINKDLIISDTSSTLEQVENITTTLINKNLTLTSYISKAGVSKNVTNNTDTEIGYIDLSEGFWILFGMFHFDANTSGTRRGNFSLNSGSGDMNFNIAPPPTSATRYRNIMIYNLSSTTRVYANVKQTSGSTLGCYCQFWAIRIGSHC